jgi:quercetin dioxygenase-like cupin family protein
MVLRLFLIALVTTAGIRGQSGVEIDNAWVRVLRVKVAPREKSPAHAHPASVAVYLTDARLRINGKEVTRKAGDVAWFEAANYTDESLSDQPIELIVMELKPGAPKAQGWPVKLDPVKLDPVHHQVPFENTRVRILRTILEPHLKGPTHDHPSYVVVYLTELHTTMTLADGKQVDNPRHPGEVAWRDAYRHTTENVGDRTAVEIQIELK